LKLHGIDGHGLTSSLCKPQHRAALSHILRLEVLRDGANQESISAILEFIGIGFRGAFLI